MARTSSKLSSTKYGRAEWYGELFRTFSPAKMQEFMGKSFRSVVCPFLADVPRLAPAGKTKGEYKVTCNKSGGVCSIMQYGDPLANDGEHVFGPIVTTCPNRFLQDGEIIRHIGKTILGTETPLFAKELPFLRRPRTAAAAQAVAETEAEEDTQDLIEEDGTDDKREDVGRIDLVFVHPEHRSEWCAVELQAVYFSGDSMGKDDPGIREHQNPNGIPMPIGSRRPDFRSSGPKRLMPQLMIKVPSLRRWGKKMVVVIDRPFLDAMDEIPQVDHVSNCDIVWIVVRYDESVEPGKATLVVDQTLYTTLEDSIVGLTAGKPTTMPAFESRLMGKVGPVFD